MAGRLNKGLVVEDGKIKTLTLSPSGIKSFENCPAGYLFGNLSELLPNIGTKEGKEIAKAGKLLHSISEEDYDEDFADMLLYFETEKKKKDVKQLKATAETREYLKYPNVNEVFLRRPIGSIGFLRGIPDKIARDGGIYHIIDLKTTGNPNPTADRKQTLAYAYMLVYVSKQINTWLGDRKPKDIDTEEAVKELAPKLNIDHSQLRKVIEITNYETVEPSKILMVLDYVRVDKIFEYKLMDGELKKYENYLISIFKQVKKVIELWLSSKDINKIEHHPGECAFCPMKGICLAYHMTVNPHYDPIHPKMMKTEEIIKELMDREYAKKVNEERAKALKTALLNRHKEGDSSISDHYVFIQSKKTSYPTADVLMRIVPKLLKKPAKNIEFGSMIDWDLVYKTVSALIRSLTGEYMTASNIPEQFLQELDDLKRTYTTKPYLKQKN